MLKILILYGTTVFIWGSTWLGIKFQLGRIDPLVSVFYRFALAALLLFVFCAATRLPMRFKLRDHAFIALQGACLFAINYWLFYLSELYLTSGIVAVTFSTIVFWNIVNGFLFIGSPVKPAVFFGAALGSIGICMVFWPELSHFSLADDGFKGLLLSLAATLLASFGNILSARNQRNGLPVIQTNAYGMGYAAVILAGLVLVLDKPVAFDPTFMYTASLLYLAVFGSIVAFGCYLSLIGRIGADRAAYATLLFPLIALALSTVFEGYQWPPSAIAGVVIILIGNAIALRTARPQAKSAYRSARGSGRGKRSLAGG